MRLPPPSLLALFLLAAAPAALNSQAALYRVATYNLENYRDQPAGSRAAKTPAAKAKIRETLAALRADIIALQEVGSLDALHQLRAALQAEGLDYPHWEFVGAFDTNLHLAVLSRFPITARRSHTNDSFLLFGRRHRVLRGFAELDIQVAPGCALTLITAHLKSRRAAPDADEADVREQEALLLRQKIDARLKRNPDLRLILLGDLNDTKDSASTRAVIGRGRFALVDTRPAERNGDDPPPPRPHARNVTWTCYFEPEDTYSRIDYILLSPALARDWVERETAILSLPGWGTASDHRPLVAAFKTPED